MCGIAGFYLREEADGKAIASKLLDGIEHRGRDATGIAWWGVNDSGKPTVWLQKAPVPARQFVKSMAIPDEARIVVAHTRAATQGSPEVNTNNHPIAVAETIVGVHNGMIRNDDALWDAIGKDVRAAEVDSEVIFGGIYALVNAPEPNAKQYGPFLKRLEGGAAIAWLDTREIDRLHVGKVRNSPCIFGWTEAGSMLFASTEAAVKAGARAGGLELAGTVDLSDGELFTFGPEGTERMESFELPPQTWGKGATDWRKNQLGASGTSGRGGGRSSTPKAGSQSTTPTTQGSSTPTSRGSNKPVSQASRRGFTDDAERVIQSHSDALRGLAKVPIREGERKHTELYDARETAIQAFVETEMKVEEALLIANGTKNAEEAATTKAFDLTESAGGFAREGDWVSTTFDGDLRMGQIVSMPQSFPAGHYLIRLYVPCTTGHDTCLVSRVWSDLDYVGSASQIDASRVLD